MRILLIRPFSKNYQTNFDISGPVEPTNLLYLAGPLLKNNHAVKILDFEAEPFTKTEFRKVLEDFLPGIVGISCFSTNVIYGHFIAKQVKVFNSKIITVVGGPHVTCLPRETLEKHAFFDFGILGEAEFAFLELINKIENNFPFSEIKGLVYRENSSIIQTGDPIIIDNLDAIPIPPRHLLNMERYLEKPQTLGIWKRSLNLYTSRGCPFSCHFCANTMVHGRKVRFHSLEYVASEISEAVEKYKIEHLAVRDSNFTINTKRTIDFCLMLKTKFPFLTFNMETKVNLINRTFLKALKTAGCTKIAFGVESGSFRVLRQMGKQITIREVIEAFRLCKEFRIPTQVFFMLGHPNETREDLLRTQEIIRRIKPDYLFISIVIPLPGTEYYQQFAQIASEKELTNFLCFNGSPTWLAHQNIEPIFLQKLQRKLYISYAFSLSRIWNFIKGLYNFNQVKYYVKSFLGLLRYLQVIPL